MKLGETFLTIVVLTAAWHVAAAGSDDRDRLFERAPATTGPGLLAARITEEPNFFAYVGGFYDDVDAGVSTRGVPYELTYDPSPRWEFAAAGDAYDVTHDSANGKSSGIGDVTLKATRAFAGSGAIKTWLQAKVLLPVGSDDVSSNRTDWIVNGRLSATTGFGVWKLDATARRYGDAESGQSRYGYKGVVAIEKGIGQWGWRGEYADSHRDGTSHVGVLGLIGKRPVGNDTVYLTLQKGVTSNADRAYAELGYEWGLRVR